MQLGEQLGAHPEAVAGDPVDHELRPAVRDRRRVRSRSAPSGDPPIRAAERRAVLDALARAGAATLVDLPFGAEDAERAQELADGAVRMAAGAATGELAGPALDPLEVVALGPAASRSAPVASAIARRPNTHGPHWAALWPAM